MRNAASGTKVLTDCENKMLLSHINILQQAEPKCECYRNLKGKPSKNEEPHHSRISFHATLCGEDDWGSLVVS
jgi:hypothetical protein